jgi:hypothetical protein
MDVSGSVTEELGEVSLEIIVGSGFKNELASRED